MGQDLVKPPVLPKKKHIKEVMIYVDKEIVFESGDGISFKELINTIRMVKQGSVIAIFIKK